MKRVLLRILMITQMRLGLVIALLLATNAYAGQEGHGGDIAASIFLGIARSTNDCLIQNKSSWLDYPLLSDELNAMFLAAKVYSVDKTTLDGQEVDAINYPDIENPKILINRNRWLTEHLENSLRATLILHEYLSLIGYNDQQYQMSYPLIQKNKMCINNNDYHKQRGTK